MENYWYFIIELLFVLIIIIIVVVVIVILLLSVVFNCSYFGFFEISVTSKNKANSIGFFVNLFPRLGFMLQVGTYKKNFTSFNEIYVGYTIFEEENENGRKEFEEEIITLPGIREYRCEMNIKGEYRFRFCFGETLLNSWTF